MLDLRTSRPELIKPHIEYPEGQRGGSWPWFDGQQHWWETFLVWLNGWDGAGNYVCERRWRWNGSSQTIRAEYVHLPESEIAKLAEGTVQS